MVLIVRSQIVDGLCLRTAADDTAEYSMQICHIRALSYHGDEKTVLASQALSESKKWPTNQRLNIANKMASRAKKTHPTNRRALAISSVFFLCQLIVTHSQSTVTPALARFRCIRF
jgi:hypothetical protein